MREKIEGDTKKSILERVYITITFNLIDISWIANPDKFCRNQA